MTCCTGKKKQSSWNKVTLYTVNGETVAGTTCTTFHYSTCL